MFDMIRRIENKYGVSHDVDVKDISSIGDVYMFTSTGYQGCAFDIYLKTGLKITREEDIWNDEQHKSREDDFRSLKKERDELLETWKSNAA